MIQFLLRNLSRFLLWLRYRVRVRGLDEVARRGARGIVFLPNHPALIDPIILMTLLNKRFAPRAVADQDQIDRPFIRWFAKVAGVLPLPSIARYGPGARPEIERTLAKAVEGVRRGENLLFYPAGHAQHSRLEDLRGNSGAEMILRGAPEARIVLVRTRGLWGSSFSWASGRPPDVGRALKKGAARLLLSAIFFGPRREVTIEFFEPTDFPRTAAREDVNRYLESCYNQEPQPNTYVPYTIWERGGVAELPEPEGPRLAGEVGAVPPATREIVLRHLRELTGRDHFGDQEHLARDLGLDSLARTELLAWLEAEFGFPQGDADAVRTVGDVLLAACGETAASEFMPLNPVPPRWFADSRTNPALAPPAGETITQAFLHQARRAPRKAIIADQLRGARTYRDIVLGVLLLKPHIERLEGTRVGIMLPASVAADVVYLATLFAGKTPVMVNWTLGPRNVVHSLDSVGARHVLTVEALPKRLESQGNDLSALGDRFLFLEHVLGKVSFAAKLAAWLRSRLCWSSLETAEVPPTAAVLFTSGSETLPKAVPLSHQNMLGNLRDVLHHVTPCENDRVLGFLPPFHSYGLTVTVLGPLCAGLRTVYHPNPNEGAALARLIEAYKATILISTPTFLKGILRTATRRQLATLRLAVTGAEKCPEGVYDALSERCPQAAVLEGYGVTECSPIISVNEERAPKRGTIGKLLPSFERLLVDPETGRPVQPPGTGALLVRGPCVFAGYLPPDVPSPFIELYGKAWYRTGDVVSEDESGVLTFRGRITRFIKLGGEMISLAAIEAVLWQRYTTEEDKGPVIAVEATPDDAHPEILLYTTKDLDRQTVNAQIREAGLSALHNVRRVIKVPEIPVLGTGKTDYRALRARLTDGAT
jgi:long-chain-fatty-acid--[acyl-carrier-protein] ligase